MLKFNNLLLTDVITNQKSSSIDNRFFLSWQLRLSELFQKIFGGDINKSNIRTRNNETYVPAISWSIKGDHKRKITIYKRT